MAPPRDVEVEGVTTFHPPSTSYRYILNLKDNKLSIWMEDKTTKQQWFKADVAQGDYIPANAITDTSALDFVKRFQLALDCELGKCDDVQRKVDFYQCGALRLTFTVQFQLRRSVGATKYTFKLDPFSIEHIDELKSKLRDQQEELDQLRSAHRVLPFVQFEASTKNATTGKLLWKSVESDIFHVIDAEVLIRRPGRYSVAAVVNSAKQNDYAGLRKNKTCITSAVCSCMSSRFYSATLSSVIELDERDTVSIECDGDVGSTCYLTIAQLGC